MKTPKNWNDVSLKQLIEIEAIKSLLSTEATPIVEQPAEAVAETKEPVIDVSDLKHTLNNFIYKLNS